MDILVGLIRVLTTTDPELLAAHGRIVEHEYGLRTVSRCIADQPQGIYDEATELRALPKIVRLGHELIAEGARAILVSCAADPAVKELRAELKVPVIGAGSSVAAVAISLADRVGILNLTEGAPGPILNILGSRFVGEDSPTGVHNTLDLMTEWGGKAALEAAARLADRGAGALALACTGYATIGMAARLRRELGILAVDPVRAAGLMTLYALKQA